MQIFGFTEIATWIHNLDPFIFEIAGFGPRWYGLAYIIGLVAGWYIVMKWAKQQRVPIEPAAVQDLALYFGLGMIIGGRLGYCFFYDTSLLMPPWQILFVWQGGMASHGGIIGMFVGVLLYCRKNNIPFWVIADASAVVTPIGICAGRLANFINGELWGRPTDVSWGMHFPHSYKQDIEYEFLDAAGNPNYGSTAYNEAVLQASTVIRDAEIQLVSITNFMGSEAATALRNKARLDPEAWQQWQQLVNDAFIHFKSIEQNSDAWIQWQQWIAEYVLVRHPSQLYAAFMEGIVVISIGLLVHRFHRRPGLSLGVILSTYAIMRFINEFWRNPDTGYELFLGWMSKGQLLSIPLLAIGIGFIIWAYKRGPKAELYQLQAS